MDYNYNQAIRPGILWSCVSRRKERSNQDVIVAEAYENPLDIDPLVTETQQKLLSKKATPGWEFYTLSHMGVPKLKSMKFHIYHHVSADEDDDEAETDFTIWIVACVYNPAVIQSNVAKFFIDKIIQISKPFREYDENWMNGLQYAAQQDFSPILHQQMQQVLSTGKIATLKEDLDSLKQIMARNIDVLMMREERIDKLKRDGEKMNEMAAVFKTKTKKLKKKMLWQNAKYGVVVGTAVTVGVAAVTVPIVASL